MIIERIGDTAVLSGDGDVINPDDIDADFESIRTNESLIEEKYLRDRKQRRDWMKSHSNAEGVVDGIEAADIESNVNLGKPGPVIDLGERAVAIYKIMKILNDESRSEAFANNVDDQGLAHDQLVRKYGTDKLRDIRSGAGSKIHRLQGEVTHEVSTSLDGGTGNTEAITKEIRKKYGPGVAKAKDRKEKVKAAYGAAGQKPPKPPKK